MTTVRYSKGEIGKRPWGQWEVLDTADRFCVKRIDILPASRLSLQLHHHRREDWIIVAGQGVVELDASIVDASPGMRFHIPLRAKHRISNTGVSILTFIEIQHGYVLDENDIVRLEDDYGR
jgi:mannose-6-phosphate isomerase-like protein (cupin superfamily)